MAAKNDVTTAISHNLLHLLLGPSRRTVLWSTHDLVGCLGEADSLVLELEYDPPARQERRFFGSPFPFDSAVFAPIGCIEVACHRNPPLRKIVGSRLSGQKPLEQIAEGWCFHCCDMLSRDLERSKSATAHHRLSAPAA